MYSNKGDYEKYALPLSTFSTVAPTTPMVWIASVYLIHTSYVSFCGGKLGWLWRNPGLGTTIALRRLSSLGEYMMMQAVPGQCWIFPATNLLFSPSPRYLSVIQKDYRLEAAKIVKCQLTTFLIIADIDICLPLASKDVDPGPVRSTN